VAASYLYSIARCTSACVQECVGEVQANDGPGYPSFCVPAHDERGGAINYIHIDMLRAQAQELRQLEAHQRAMPCEGLENVSSCEQPAEYLMPDATRPGSEGSDIEIRPAWFCRRHLSMLLGRDPGEQPHFRRIEGSDFRRIEGPEE
jgi:hypothetical protein